MGCLSDGILIIQHVNSSPLLEDIRTVPTNMQEIETNLKISSFCVNVLSIIILDLIGSDPINTQTGPNMIA
jgi:hypothetical protein